MQPGAPITPHLTQHRQGFPPGYTPITREGEPDFDTGVELAVLKLAGDEPHVEADAREAAWVLLHGKIEVRFDGRREILARTSLFDEGPAAFHLPPKQAVEIRALGGREAELMVAKTSNDRDFAPRVFRSEELSTEFRGKGLAQEACLRQVRQIFDLKDRPESNLVLGEVVNYPGRWSSYPPHHHDQPEIYHYRFTHPQGYGHAELGEEVLRVRDRDTVKILGGRDHAQVSAPGYGMYYLWVIRHLPGNPYRGFEFTEDHRWVLNPEDQGWRPRA